MIIHTSQRAHENTSTRILIVASASLFVDYMAYAMMVPLTPVSPAGIHCTADESIIVFAYSIGLLVAATNIRHVCQHLSHRSQMLLGTGSLACALCLIGTATHLSVYILGRFLQGIAAAITSIVGFSAVASAYPHQRVRMLGVVLGAGSAGFISGPLFGGLLFGVGTYGLPFLCFGLPLILLALAQWCYLGRHHIHSANSRDRAPPPARTSIRLPALLAALCAASWATLEGLVPLTLYQDYAQTPQAVGTLFSANSLLSLLTSLLIVLFASKVTSSLLAIIGLIASCAIFLALALIAHLYALWLAVPLAGVAYAVLVNASTALFAERVEGASTRDDHYQRAYSVFSIAYGLGYSIGSGVEYVCASFASFHSINLAVGCLFASLLPLFAKYRARPHGR